MKADRQAKILTLISEHKIETQEELQQRLEDAGFNVTQATISRDMRELRINKVVSENGKQYYGVLSPKDPDYLSRFTRILMEGYTSADVAGNIMVVKTIIGMAMAFATALDNLEFQEIVGCVAGDDTVIVVTRTASDAFSLMKKIKQITETTTY